MYVVVLWMITLGSVWGRTTVTAEPLFVAENKAIEAEKPKPEVVVQNTAPQDAPPRKESAKDTSSRVSETPAKAPPVVVKKKTLLQTKYRNSKRSTKKFKKAVIRRA